MAHWIIFNVWAATTTTEYRKCLCAMCVVCIALDERVPCTSFGGNKSIKVALKSPRIKGKGSDVKTATQMHRERERESMNFVNWTKVNKKLNRPTNETATKMLLFCKRQLCTTHIFTIEFGIDTSGIWNMSNYCLTLQITKAPAAFKSSCALNSIKHNTYIETSFYEHTSINHSCSLGKLNDVLFLLHLQLFIIHKCLPFLPLHIRTVGCLCFFFLYSKWLFICAIPKCFVIFRRNQAIQSVVIGDWVKCNSLIVKLVFVLLLSNYCILHFISMKKKIVTLLTLYHFLFSYPRYSIFICFIFIELSIYSISYVNRKKNKQTFW